MVEKTIDPKRFQAVHEKIERDGRCAPLSLQYDIDLNANGNRYILRVQLVKKHKVVVLQAVQWWYDHNIPGGKGYKMLAKDEYLSALLVMLVHKCSDTDYFVNANADVCEAVHTLDAFDKRYENIMAKMYEGKAHDG